MPSEKTPTRLIVQGKEYHFKPDILMEPWARGRLLIVRLDPIMTELALADTEEKIEAARAKRNEIWEEILSIAFSPEDAKELTLEHISYRNMLEIVGLFTPAALDVLPKPATA